MKKFFYSAALVVAALAMTACGGASYSSLKSAIEKGDATKAAQIAMELEEKGVELTEEQQKELEELMTQDFFFEYVAACMALEQQGEDAE